MIAKRNMATMFRGVTPPIRIDVYRHFGRTYLQSRILSRLALCSAYFSTLKMEEVDSSETSVTSTRLLNVVSQKITKNLTKLFKIFVALKITAHNSRTEALYPKL
jgi:hypothetical protein